MTGSVLTLACLLFLASGTLSSKEPVLVEDVAYFEPLSLTLHSIKRGEAFPLSFFSHDRNFDLRLVPHNTLFHPEVKFTYEAENGEFKEFEFDTHSLYTGEAFVGDDKSQVSLRIDTRKNLMTGIILGANHSFAIEPSHHFYSEPQPFNMVIYKWSDIKHTKKEMCGNKQEHNTVPLAEQVRRTVSSRQINDVCTVSMVADSRLFELFGNVVDTTNNLVDVLAASQTLYRSQNVGGFQLISTRVYTDASKDPFRTDSQNYGQFLSAVTQLKNDIPPSQGRCLLHARTFFNYNGILGFSQVGTICDVGGAAGTTTVNSFGKKANLLIQFLAIAHEFGHNFGSNHDSSGNYLMHPSITEDTLHQFSQLSVDSIDHTKSTNSKCLISDRSAIGTCGNGFVEEGEECDCGASCATSSFCSSDCKLKAGKQCDPSNGLCCSTDGQFLAKGANCGHSPIPGVPAPTCTGTSAICPSCYPGNSHPCDQFTNLSPCDVGHVCKAGCVFDGQTFCYPATQISGITQPNLPDGTCCPGGHCMNGICVGSSDSNPSGRSTTQGKPPVVDIPATSKVIGGADLVQSTKIAGALPRAALFGIIGGACVLVITTAAILIVVALYRRRLNVPLQAVTLGSMQSAKDLEESCETVVMKSMTPTMSPHQRTMAGAPGE